MAQTLSAAEMAPTRMNWVRNTHTLALNLQNEICLHPAFKNLGVQEAEDVNLLKWDIMLDKVMELAEMYLNLPATDEKQSYVELWVLVDDVYNSMSSHMANPNLTEGRRFICEDSAIGLAYEKFREHRFEYWMETWGMEFDAALEQERETLT